MTFNFDTVFQRRGSGAIKWDMYDADVLPMWVADMDFRSPEPVIRALHERVEHGFFGYEFDSQPLREILVARMAAQHHWQIRAQDIKFLPNLVSALNWVTAAYSEPGDDILMLTPSYPPFLSAPLNAGRNQVTCDLKLSRDDQIIRYDIDFEAFEAAITPRTKVFLMCNPHNPVGRMWTRAELERMAEICLRHKLVICSDEIHCDLILDDKEHISFATLGPEVAARTITLLSPSKTFNLPTLEFALAVATDESLLKQLQKTTSDFLPHPGALALRGALAAYGECQEWHDALLPYLKANRDYLLDYVRQNFPQVGITCPEATYLAWLDWRLAELPDTPFNFFLEKARVAFADGAVFGKAGEGFVRLNFGTPRELLHEGLERVRRSL